MIMFGLVLKDYYVMRKSIRYYLAFLLIYGVLTAVGYFPYSILAGMVALMGLMLPMSSFAFDDQARWDKFAVSAPAGRRGVVGGKYLFALLGTAATALLISGILMVMSLLNFVETEVWWEPLAVVGSCVCVTLLLDSLFLPFLVKFGAEKTRILSLLVFGAVFGGMAALALLAEKGFSLPSFPPEAAVLAPVLLVAVTAAALAASYAASLSLYGRKEF